MKNTKFLTVPILLLALSSCTNTPAFKYEDVPAVAHNTIDTLKKEKEKNTAITSISIEPKDITLSPKSTENFQVVALHSDGSSEEVKGGTFSIDYETNDTDYLTVDHTGVVHATDSAISGDHSILKVAYGDYEATARIQVKTSLSDTIVQNEDGLSIITNYDHIDVLVNKTRNLPADYIPNDLVKPNVPFSFSGENERRYLRKEAAHALEKLFEGANNDGIKLVGVSGYRSYKTQKWLFDRYVQSDGYEAANKYSARPGQSEHQTGLTIDVSCSQMGYDLDQSFEETEEGKWLKENAYKYGFIIRYPKEKEDITQYVYEPWHIRYVGVNIAKEIMTKGLCLEEYFEE